MLVADGLGGLPMQPGGLTELETARTPNLDALATRGVQGASIPVLPGDCPGKRPRTPRLIRLRPAPLLDRSRCPRSHRIGFELQPGDVAVRCNFCTLDESGKISDRRAGRISSE